MLTAYLPAGSCLARVDANQPGARLEEAVWLDLLDPTAEEDRRVEAVLGVSVPTREDMAEIEMSSRLYKEDGALYMTAVLLCQADTNRPRVSAVTFILAGGRLATVRYDETRPFPMFETRAVRPNSGVVNGCDALLGLLDSIVDRIADVLERVGAEVDQISQQVFHQDIGRSRGPQRDYGRLIRAIAQQGHVIGKIQESLVSLSRLVPFFAEEGHGTGMTPVEKTHIMTQLQDVKSLTDYAVALDGKIGFLLDATLGLVSLQQNTIVKIFSVLAVVFMPPTLIASIYGMNFRLMPELDWAFGYPMALGMMLTSVGLTYAVFKWRGWL